MDSVFWALQVVLFKGICNLRGLGFGPIFRVSNLRGLGLIFFFLILLWFFSFPCTSSKKINLLSMGNHRKTVHLQRSIAKFVFESKIFAIENEA